VVYFPAGTYKISSSIIDYYYTQIIGDPTNMPVIKGTPDFSPGTLCLIEADKYTNSGYLQFGSTNVFFRQVRNIIFDTTDVQIGACGIVSTSLLFACGKPTLTETAALAVVTGHQYPELRLQAL
jgi:glucan 1,3-beta-glucosidase